MDTLQRDDTGNVPGCSKSGRRRGYRSPGITKVINDQNAARVITGQRLVVAFLVGFFLFLFWHNQREYRVTGEWNAFAKSAAWLILIGGVWAWVGYFGDHNAFFAWPVVVVVVFFAVLFWRAFAEDRHKREEAERMRGDFPEPPNNKGGPADLKDFADWTEPPEREKQGKVIDFRDLLKAKKKMSRVRIGYIDRSFGKPMWYPGNAGHLVTIAPTGSGKGRDVLIPALLDESMKEQLLHRR